MAYLLAACQHRTGAWIAPTRFALTRATSETFKEVFALIPSLSLLFLSINKTNFQKSCPSEGTCTLVAHHLGASLSLRDKNKSV